MRLQLNALQAAMVSDLISPRVQFGALYRPGPDERLDALARQAFKLAGRRPSDAELLDYLHTMQSVPHNRRWYGSTSWSKAFPQTWLVPGIGTGVHSAFSDVHDDLQRALEAGQYPIRTINASGAPVVVLDAPPSRGWLFWPLPGLVDDPPQLEKLK